MIQQASHTNKSNWEHTLEHNVTFQWSFLMVSASTLEEIANTSVSMPLSNSAFWITTVPGLELPKHGNSKRGVLCVSVHLEVRQPFREHKMSPASITWEKSLFSQSTNPTSSHPCRTRSNPEERGWVCCPLMPLGANLWELHRHNLASECMELDLACSLHSEGLVRGCNTTDGVSECPENNFWQGSIRERVVCCEVRVPAWA